MRNLGLGLLLVMVGGLATACGAAKMADPAAPAAQPAYESPASRAGADTEAIATSAAPGGGGLAAPPPPPAPPPAVADRSSSKAESAPRARPAPAPASSPIVAEPAPQRLPQSGQLTAGVWDDNKNFDFFKPYAIRFREQRGPDFAMFSDAELANARSTGAQQQAHTELDIQLVLDTTGSMGDELAYLQSEFDAIAARLKTRFPNVSPRWSLVAYRDHGDEYVTRPFDFTNDTSRFRTNLRAQMVAGGGDTPEAVVEGLQAGLRQSWRRDGNVAKIAFWVADAPAHPGEGKALANVVRDAKAKGVHIYPVASSDTDDAAEYQMRSAAQLTGGRYVFLTNDSGIGNGHAEPHIPCYNVTRLDQAIVRMIAVELTGRYVEAESSEVVRSVGKPNKEGKCQLSSGMLVASY